MLRFAVRNDGVNHAASSPARGRTGRAMAALLVATVVVLVGASHARANGVPLTNGDVLAATGNGQVKNFSPSGTLLDTLDTTTGSTYTTGMCFDSSNDLFVTDFSTNALSEFDTGGNLKAASFATTASTPESCAPDASNNLYVGGPSAPAIYKFSPSGTLLNTYSVTADGSGTGGTDWVDLASDECTVLYTDEGVLIKSFNVCTNTQNADFASGLPGPCFELRIRPNGEVVVACASEVVRLSSTGAVLQTYPIAGVGQLFALNLDPDGTSFWTGDDGNGEVYHVDIATGNILGQFNSAPATGLFGVAIVGGIVVSQPTIMVTPATGTQAVGSPYTVTATITNPGGSLTGQTIHFSVSGANTATGTGTTNSSGQATFTYTGTHAGGDTITASFTNSHSTTVTGTAAVTWTGAVADPKLTDFGISETHLKETWCDPVASFTDPDATGRSSAYAFTINWGDGKVSPGTPTGSGATWTVGGCHTYAKVGTYKVKTTAVDNDGSGNVVTAMSTQIVR